MNFNELRAKIQVSPIFTIEDILKWFPEVDYPTLKNQLFLWTKIGYLERIKKGLYKNNEWELKDNLILTRYIYFPSYISLESALNYYGLIPDIPFSVTAVTNKKTSSFSNKHYGLFIYRHIKPELFFGYQEIKVGNWSYLIACPEKAFFDFLYLNYHRINPQNFIKEFRLDMIKDFNWRKFKKYSQLVKTEKFSYLTKIILDYYDQ